MGIDKAIRSTVTEAINVETESRDVHFCYTK